MSQIMKGFLGVFFLVLIVVCGLSISTSMLNAANAKTFKANMITEMENSNFNYTVINECLAQGTEKGYDVKLKIFTEDINSGERKTKVITSASASDSYGAYMAEVLVKYSNKIVVFGIDEVHELRGYAK